MPSTAWPKGLSRLADFDFPVQLDDITKVYFERQGKIEGGEIGQAMLTLAQNPSDSAAIAKLSAEPYFNSQMRTTCVATQISGGHAENALPQTARATINCRMLPSHDPQEVQATLLEVLDDDAISLAVTWKPTPSPPSPLSPEMLGAVESGHRGYVAGSDGASHHARWRDRWPFSAQRGHPDLRYLRHLPRCRRYPGPWPGRTRRGRAVL